MCRFLLHITDRQSNKYKSTTIRESRFPCDTHQIDIFEVILMISQMRENLHLYRITMRCTEDREWSKSNSTVSSSSLFLVWVNDRWWSWLQIIEFDDSFELFDYDEMAGFRNIMLTPSNLFSSWWRRCEECRSWFLDRLRFYSMKSNRNYLDKSYLAMMISFTFSSIARYKPSKCSNIVDTNIYHHELWYVLLTMKECIYDHHVCIQLSCEIINKYTTFSMESWFRLGYEV